jgi:hypothetical protein
MQFMRLKNDPKCGIDAIYENLTPHELLGQLLSIVGRTGGDTRAEHVVLQVLRETNRWKVVGSDAVAEWKKLEV